jgi:hypothetical protein
VRVNEPDDFFTGSAMRPFVGVVENVNDPRQTGRVQVRAIGYHPEKGDQGVPTQDLPWAYVLQPTTSSGMSGMGSTHDLKDGSWVFGYFLDGRDAQQPFVVGSFGGAPGMTPDQQQHVQSGLGIASTGPGGLGGAFQTLLGSVVGGLGAGGKFGATSGSVLDLSKFLENEDAVKALQSLGRAQDPALSWRAPEPITNAFNSLTSDRIQKALSGQDFSRVASTGAAASAMGFQGLGDSVFKSGGATTGPTGRAGPLAAANMGTTGQQPSAGQSSGQQVTSDVQVDYDAFVNSCPENTGMVTVHCSDTPKHARYSLASMDRDHRARADMDGKGIGYHAVIAQSGQLTQTRDPTQRGSHVRGKNSIKVGGQSMQNIGVCLVGGRPASGQSRNLSRLPMDAKFYAVQLAVLEKLIKAFIKRFPKIKVAGHNEFSSKECPTFNVGEWMQHVSSQNANKNGGISGDGSVPPSGDVDPRNGDVEGEGTGDDRSVDGGSSSNRERGFQGGVAHPVPSYASTRQPDWPAPARTNALTGGRGTSGKGTGAGGPVQQYLAKIEEPALHRYQVGRPSDSLEARKAPDDWAVPQRAHGGEYNQTHVVRATEGGHHIVLDDTAGRQKVEILHAGGSMVQMHHDGSAVYYAKKDKHDVVVGKSFVGVSGDMTESVGGTKRVKVEGDLIFDVTGKVMFNVNGDMHELVMGNKVSTTAGHQMQQTKKNHVLRVGKDADFSYGGKKNEAVKGTSHETVRGNKSVTAMGESSEYVQGNKSTLALGSMSSHAKHVLVQSTGETVVASKGNVVVSSKGKTSVLSDGDVMLSGKGKVDVDSVGAMKIDSDGAMDVKSGGALKVEGQSVDVKSSGDLKLSGEEAHLVGGTTYATASDGTLHLFGATILRNTDIDPGATAGEPASSATEASKAEAAEVSDPPTELTKESVTADSEANLNAEQMPLGEIDKMVADDKEGQGGSAPGGMQSGGAAGKDDGLFSDSTQGGPVSPTGLGNSKGDACDLANQLVAKGWTPQGASAMVGHMMQESSLNPGAYTVDTNGLPSGGLAQWNGQRLTNLQNYSQQNGMDWRTGQAQIAYLDYEARTSHSNRGGFGMIGAGNMADAIKAGASFERFQGWDNGGFTGGGWGDRAGNGLGVYNECFGGTETGVGGATPGDVSGFTGGNSNTGDWSTGAGGEVTPAENVKPPVSGLDASKLDYGMKVSRYFTLGQLCPTSHPVSGSNPAGGWGKVDSSTIIKNLSGVATNVCDVIYEGLGNCVIYSGYRSEAYNKSVKGAARSDHLIGCAVDLKPMGGKSVEQFAQWIEKNIPTIAGIGRYPNSKVPFVHVSFYLEGNGGRVRRW